MKPQQQKAKVYTNDSILEALRDLSGGIGKTVTRDVVGRIGSDAVTSLFGSLKPGEAVSIPERQAQPQKTKPEVVPVSRPAITEDQQKIAKQIESVRAELKAIAASIQSLNADIGKAVSEVPVNPGVYHANFFDRLKSILIVLREQIDDSRSWLTMHTARKKKLGYWGMYKKHGTTFGLSNERSLATQAG